MAEVQYLVIGGQAMRAYGLRRATSDLDLILGSTLANVTAATPVLRIRFRLPDGNTPEDLLVANRLLKSDSIDVLTSIDGVDFASAFNRSVRKRLDANLLYRCSGLLIWASFLNYCWLMVWSICGRSFERSRPVLPNNPKPSRISHPLAGSGTAAMSLPTPGVNASAVPGLAAK